MKKLYINIQFYDNKSNIYMYKIFLLKRDICIDPSFVCAMQLLEKSHQECRNNNMYILKNKYCC